VQRTERFIRVARVFVQDPDGRHFSSDVMRQARLRGAVVYPMLTRMMEDDLIVDGWVEWPTRNSLARLLMRMGVLSRAPARRYYALTDKGRQQLGALVASDV
jgi:PadR family transcriptional regulator, regulatory protein PadR